MSSEERDVFFAALQRGQFAENDVTINVIGHVGSSPKSLIRSFAMGGARENKKTKENLRMFMGRRKHIVKNKGDFSGYTLKKNPYAFKFLFPILIGRTFEICK